MRGELQQDLDRAARLMADFSGHQVSRARVIRVKEPRAAFEVGPLEGLIYGAKRDGRLEHYVHEFAPRSRPLLAVSSDGTQLRIVGGRFQFTEAGIEDR